MRVHPLLADALAEAGAYRVLPSKRGFHLWRFTPWGTARPGGWRIVVADLRTQEDAWMHALKRLGLMRDDAPAPLPPAAEPYDPHAW